MLLIFGKDEKTKRGRTWTIFQDFTLFKNTTPQPYFFKLAFPGLFIFIFVFPM